MTQKSILEKDETSSSCGQLQLQFSVFIILLINIDIYRSTQRSKHFDQQHKGVKVLTFVNIINQSNEIHYVLCCRDISGISTITTMLTIPVMLTLPTVQVCKRIIKQQLAESHSMCEYANYVQVDTMLMMSVFKSIQSRS